MPGAFGKDNMRVTLRISPEQKAVLARAAALERTDLTNSVTHAALREAESVIKNAGRVRLSERDSLLVLKLLENPPRLSKKLKAAVTALPKRK